MRLADIILIQFEYPANTWVTVTPVIEELEMSKAKEKGTYLYRTECDVSFTLIGDDYNFIRAIEETNHCAEVGVRFFCNPAQEETDLLYFGTISMNDVDFDYSNCIATLRVIPDDLYACLKRELKKQINILASTNNVTVNFLIGEIEYQRCPPSGTTSITGLLPVNAPVQDSCLTDPATWAVIENHFSNIQPSGGAPPWSAEHFTEWARQVVTSVTMPPGDGWVNIGGNVWARPVATEYDPANSTSPPNPPNPFGDWIEKFRILYAEEPPMDNGQLLKDAIIFMLSQNDCRISVTSMFFGWNPQVGDVPPVNIAYTEAALKLQNLVIFQKSDVKRANVSNNAIIGEISMDEMFQLLEAMFQVYPTIDGIFLRFEHITYYTDNPVGLDLTGSSNTYRRWIKGNMKYSYTNDENPRYERFRWMDDIPSFFKGHQIIYDAFCSSKDNDIKEYIANKVTTDVQWILDFPDAISDEGFVIVNAAKIGTAYYIQDESGHLNGHLSFINLHDNYWRHYRFQESGIMNSTATAFLSTRGRRKQKSFVLPGWCCGDFSVFNPKSLVKTDFGEGTVERITWRAKAGTVTFDLSYP